MSTAPRGSLLGGGVWGKPSHRGGTVFRVSIIIIPHGMILAVTGVVYVGFFPKMGARPSFPYLERTVLDFWDCEDVFSKSLEWRGTGQRWVVYDGPPGPNGPPHIGHMMQSALKDLWPRFKTMQGFYVPRRAGWDTHGLPIEQAVSADKNLRGKDDIEAFGVREFMDACRSTVETHRATWESAIKRVGRWVDLENAYRTMDRAYIQSDWWTIKKAHEKGLLYRGERVLPVSPKLSTPISNHEASSNYQEVTDLSCVVTFPFRDDPKTAFLAWTTTPWTLIGNVALALGPDIPYLFVEHGDMRYVLAESRLKAYEKQLPDGTVRVIKRCTGSELSGIAYQPSWEFYADENHPTLHRTVADSYVTDQDGTGIVHLAAYGADDYRLISAYGIPLVQHVGINGHFAEGTGEYTGKYFRADGVDVAIIRDLAGRGRLFAKERYAHSYPFCPRTQEPLLYFVRKSWFLRTSSIQEAMIEANNQIRWYPGHIQQGRFGKWLENIVDWCISRERYWGSPIPVWHGVSCDHQLVIGSLEELATHSASPLPSGLDLHKPAIDDVECVCPECGGVMHRDPDVLDCWFNAGIMPWAQHGFPHTPGSQTPFSDGYPADFICEGLDQTRGWFYTLLATSIMAQEGPSYRQVMCTGLVLDEHGQKMSKSKGNVIAPTALFDEFGADACRWYLFTIHPGNNVLFGPSAVRDTVRLYLLPIWNVASFFSTYAEADRITPSLLPEGSLPASPLDRWLLAELYRLSESITTGLEAFDAPACMSSFAAFLDGLSNWYVRRARRRFWKGGHDRDKGEAYQTLYTTLYTLVRLLAPFTPFISEYLYQVLFRDHVTDAPLSVHMTDWPTPPSAWEHPSLVDQFQVVRQVIRLGLSARKKAGIKVRQPLSCLHVAPSSDSERATIASMSSYILEELNVRSVDVDHDITSLTSWSLQPNIKVLGPKVGSDLPEVRRRIAEAAEAQIRTVLSARSMELVLDAGNVVTIGLEDVIPKLQDNSRYVVADSEAWPPSVALDTHITEDLAAEGLVREWVSRLQKVRKETGLDITDRITIQCRPHNPEDGNVLDAHRDYICDELLAVRMNVIDTTNAQACQRIEVCGKMFDVSLTPVS